MLRIEKPLKARKRLALTPLIDVIFILVMFFLLSSTFGVWQPLDVSLGRGEAAAPEKQDAARAPSVLMTVRPGPDAGSMIVAINGAAVSEKSMVEELNRLASLGATDVLLLPSNTLSFQDVVHVLDLARSSNIARISMKVD